MSNKIKEVLIGILLVLIIGLSIFYGTVKFLDLNNPGNLQVSAPVVATPIDDDEKNNLISDLENFGSSSINEEVRLQTLKSMQVSSNIDTKTKVSILNSLK